jgi:hypothetical protein
MTATPHEQTIAASPAPAGSPAPPASPAPAGSPAPPAAPGLAGARGPSAAPGLAGARGPSAAPGLAGARAPSAAPSPPAPHEPDSPYEACDQCGSPVDASQRYCVVCGTRRKHAYDPAAQFLSTATSRARSAGSSPRPASTRRRRSFSLGTAAVLAAIPVAVAVGVLVGRSPNDNNAKVLAALRQQKPTVVTVNGAGAGSGGGTAAASTSGSGSGSASTASTPVASLNSDFSLPSGYTVELQTLPRAGTTAATVATAERSERAKGATAVGLITPADFHLTPTPPAGAYVIFSGQYKTHAAATAAFAKLKGKFTGAKVIAVSSTAASSGSTKVVSHTNFGAAHQVNGFKPTAKQLSSGAQIVKRESKQINSNYVQSQKGLPDSVSVP